MLREKSWRNTAGMKLPCHVLEGNKSEEGHMGLLQVHFPPDLYKPKEQRIPEEQYVQVISVTVDSV